jgi:hypothetical protein
MSRERVSAHEILALLGAFVEDRGVDEPLGKSLLGALGIHPTLGDISILAAMSDEEMLSRIRKAYSEVSPYTLR